MHWDLMYRPPPFHPVGTCPNCGYCPCCGRSAQPAPLYPWERERGTNTTDSKYEELKRKFEEYEKRSKSHDVAFTASDAKSRSLFDLVFGDR